MKRKVVGVCHTVRCYFGFESYSADFGKGMPKHISEEEYEELKALASSGQEVWMDDNRKRGLFSGTE